MAACLGNPRFTSSRSVTSYIAALGGNGSAMYVKASGKPVFDANGEFRGYRGTGTDVTALMRAQEEHERLRQLESDLAHMNRVSMMGELGRRAGSRNHATDRQRAQQRPCGPEFSGPAAARPGRSQGGAQLRCGRYRSRRRHRRSHP